jgi:hypothetical protein
LIRTYMQGRAGSNAMTCRTNILRTLSLAAVLTLMPDAASAYDTGKLTCEQVGLLAKSIVESKQRGLSLPSALAIANIVKEGHERERQIIEDIATEIYTAPHATHLTPGGTLTAFIASCRAQK